MNSESGKIPGYDNQDCIHYWLVDVKNFGVCKKCGASKQFITAVAASSMQRAGGSSAKKVQNNVPGANI